MSENSESDGENIRCMTADVLNLLYELDDANEAMQTLVSAIVYILCNNVRTEAEARSVSSRISMIINETMSAAQRQGATIWHDGTWQ